MAESSTLANELACRLCKLVILESPVSCLVCDKTYHEDCAKRSNGTLVGGTDYVCKKCDNEYLSEIRHLIESEEVSEETKNVLMVLVKIIESKDEILNSKNYYIKLLQKKIAKLENRE